MYKFPVLILEKFMSFNEKTLVLKNNKYRFDSGFKSGISLF